MQLLRKRKHDEADLFEYLPRANYHDGNRAYQHCECERENPRLVEGQADIHSIEAEHDGRNRHDQRDQSQRTHREVQVVVDDA